MKNEKFNLHLINDNREIYHVPMKRRVILYLLILMALIEIGHSQDVPAQGVIKVEYHLLADAERPAHSGILIFRLYDGTLTGEKMDSEGRYSGKPWSFTGSINDNTIDGKFFNDDGEVKTVWRYVIKLESGGEISSFEAKWEIPPLFSGSRSGDGIWYEMPGSLQSSEPTKFSPQLPTVVSESSLAPPPKNHLGEGGDFGIPGSIVDAPNIDSKINSQHLTDVAGKEWVYSHRPDDEGGDGWVSAEEHRQTVAQEASGRVWSDRWGWTSGEEARGYEAEARGYEANLERQREIEHADAAGRQAEAQHDEERRLAEAEAARTRELAVEAARRKIAEGEAGYGAAMKQVHLYENLHFGARFTVKACDLALDKLADAANAGNPVGPGTKIKILYRSLRDAGAEVGKVYATGEGGYKVAFLKGAGTGAYDSLAEIAGAKAGIGDASRSVQLVFNTSKEVIKEAALGSGIYENALGGGLLDTYSDAGLDVLRSPAGDGADVVKVAYDLVKESAANSWSDFVDTK